MSPAPETVRPPFSDRPSISISTILSRAPRAGSELPTAGPFTADRRATSFIRRSFSGGPGPFSARSLHTLEVPLSEPNQRNNNEVDSGSTRALLLSALESRRRRIEELQSQSGQANVASTIAEQWRRQRETASTFHNPPRRISGASEARLSASPEIIGPRTPPRRLTTPPRLLFNDESSESESEDDSDNKFSNMNEARQTLSPTILIPNTSPSNHSMTSSPNHDDESSRNAYTLSCRICANVLTKRGMRARLVADARVPIWSTDEPPR